MFNIDALMADTMHCDMGHVTGWAVGLPAWVGDADSFLTGSLAFFGNGEDVDICVKVSDLQDAVAQAVAAGYTPCVGEYGGAGGRKAMRRGRHNLILCEAAAFDYMRAAHSACMHLSSVGLLATDKAHRVAIFRAVRGELGGADLE